MFFPIKKNIKTNHILISNTRLVCAGCPVRKECLQFAINNVITHGMYGGVMPRDRRLGHLKFPNGEMPFSQVVRDFKIVNGLKPAQPLPENWFAQFAEAINRTVAEVTEMLKSPDDVLLISGD